MKRILNSRFAVCGAALFGAALIIPLTSSAQQTTNLLATYNPGTPGVASFILEGPSAGSAGSFTISGAPGPGTSYRRLAFGPNGDLYVGTDTAGIRVFDGGSGVYDHSIAGTSSATQRQIAFDPSNADLYFVSGGPGYIARRDASEAAKPGAGQTGDTFVPTTSAFAVTVGPDGKVYTCNAGGLRRYSNAGGTEPSYEVNLFPFDALTSKLVFGPDVTGDGLKELYLAEAGNGRIRVVDVLSTPSSWNSNLTFAVTGLSTPIGFDFYGNNMYIAESGAGRIDRYTLSGTTWLANPTAGNTGATFAFLAGVQDIAIIPEPSALLLLGFGSLLIWRRRIC